MVLVSTKYFSWLVFLGLEGRSWTKMSICNMVRGSQKHSDRQQTHLLIALPAYKWTQGEQPDWEERDPETSDLSKAQVQH